MLTVRLIDYENQDIAKKNRIPRVFMKLTN
jgi:hypothetical protein